MSRKRRKTKLKPEKFYNQNHNESDAPNKPLEETVSNFHFESVPVNFNQESFKREVLLEKGWILVEFWTPWSIPCRKETLMLRELALERSQSLKVAKINTGMETELAQDYQKIELPSRILYFDGLKFNKSVVKKGSRKSKPGCIRHYQRKSHHEILIPSPFQTKRSHS